MVLPAAIIGTVQQWLNGIPEAQRDTPSIVLFVEGAWNTFSPNRIFQEVQRGTTTGEEFVTKMLGINLELAQP